MTARRLESNVRTYGMHLRQNVRRNWKGLIEGDLLPLRVQSGTGHPGKGGRHGSKDAGTGSEFRVYANRPPQNEKGLEITE